MTKSGRWLELEKRSCARFDKPWSYFEIPPVFEKAQGTTLVDVDGKEYIDLVAGYSSLNFGHCNADLIESARDQMNILTQTSNMLTLTRIMLAERLSKITPINGNSKVYFDIGGTVAIEVSMKLANAHSKKEKFIAFENAFHGQTFGSLSLMDTSALEKYFRIPKNRYLVPYPNCYRCQLGLDYPGCGLACTEPIRETLASHDDCAAIIAEPAVGSKGYIFPPNEFFKELRTIADEHDLVFIDDEVQMSLGRTGKMFCCEHYDTKPDIIIIAKSLGGGLWPISAVIGKQEIMDAIPPGTHTSTFCGNPLGCALGLKSLEMIEEQKLCSRSEKMGSYFMKQLEELKDRHPIIGHIEGKGLAIGIEFIKDKSKTPATKETKQITELGLKNGLLLKRAGAFKNRIALSPSLTIEKSEIDIAVSRLSSILSQVKI